MMAVLPHSLDDNQRRVLGYGAEYFHSMALTVDKSVTFGPIVGMTATHIAS
jgi:hypothetical protein